MRAFIRRVVDAITGEPESLDARRERERRKDAAKRPPPAVVCAYCGEPDHATDDCYSIIRPGDTERTWRSGGNPELSSGKGDSFERAREFWARFRGEG